MSVRTMIGETDALNALAAGATNVERIENYPGHVGALYLREEHVGRVLATGEHNYYDDSDFYAIVWDDAEQRPREVEYATTRGWTYPNSALEDATPEIIEKWRAYERRARQLETARALRVDGRVKLARDYRSKAAGPLTRGIAGDVFWLGPDVNRTRYANPHAATPQRVGVEFADGRRAFFADIDLEVVPRCPECGQFADETE